MGRDLPQPMGVWPQPRPVGLYVATIGRPEFWTSHGVPTACTGTPGMPTAGLTACTQAPLSAANTSYAILLLRSLVRAEAWQGVAGMAASHLPPAASCRPAPPRAALLAAVAHCAVPPCCSCSPCRCDCCCSLWLLKLQDMYSRSTKAVIYQCSCWHRLDPR